MEEDISTLSASELLHRATLELDRAAEDFARRVGLSDHEIRSAATQTLAHSSTPQQSIEVGTE